MSNLNPAPGPSPSMTRPDAVRLIDELDEVMESLLAILQQETECVRAGRLREAARLEPAKSDLAGRYATEARRLRDNLPQISGLAPGELAALRRRHDNFRPLLQVNMTVLATAHAVSEGIMLGVSEEMNRKAVPQTYGASGRQMAPPRYAVQPLTVSRTS